VIIWTTQSIPGDISCLFPLDASLAEIQSVGLTGKLTITGEGQSGYLTLSTATQVDGMSVSGLQAGASIPFETGAVAVEFAFDIPVIGGTTPDVIGRVNFYEHGVVIGSPQFSLRVYANNDGTFNQDVFIGVTQVYTGVAASGSINAQALVSSGVLRVWFEGTEVSLSSNAVSDVAMFPVAWIQKASGADAGDVGKTAQIQLITTAADMIGTYPSGTTDPCGNPVQTSAPTAQSLIFTSSTSAANTEILESGRLWQVRTNSPVDVTWHKAQINSAKSSGKWYYEVEAVNWTSYIDERELAVGIAPSGTATTSANGGTSNAGDGGRLQYFASGEKRSLGTYATYGDAFVSGDIIGVAWDADVKTVKFYKNGIDQGTAFTGVSAGGFVPHVCVFGYDGGNGGFRAKDTLLYLPVGYSVWAM